MPEAPPPRPMVRTKSMQIFLQADPVVRKVIKESLAEERQVMNMLKRDAIFKKLAQIVQTNTEEN
jgi:hypothetical protein